VHGAQGPTRIEPAAILAAVHKPSMAYLRHALHQEQTRRPRGLHRIDQTHLRRPMTGRAPKRRRRAIRLQIDGTIWTPRSTKNKPPKPRYLSFDDYRSCVTNAELRKKFNTHAKKANRQRLFSDAPKERLSGSDVWEIFAAAEGRCAHCGSLAVEGRPSRADGAPLPWEHIGRRIGSLEHLARRVDGGGNKLSNLVWACLWCNTWPEERRRGATDHGGFYPDESPPPACCGFGEEFSMEAGHLGIDLVDYDDPRKNPFEDLSQ
jgi:hypothetical protein